VHAANGDELENNHIDARESNDHHLDPEDRVPGVVSGTADEPDRTGYHRNKRGVSILERGSQVHDMAEFQELLDFTPAPKLDIYGKLDAAKATQAELRGQDVFFGKGQCAVCHTPPYYTDNTLHNLQVERFYKPIMINGMMASADGPIKTFPLRGIKDSPQYLHDGRLLTLEDTVEFFNLILRTKLTAEEKQDLVEFLRVL
jgi:cytochrome c peroxidase